MEGKQLSINGPHFKHLNADREKVRMDSVGVQYQLSSRTTSMHFMDSFNGHDLLITCSQY